MEETPQQLRQAAKDFALKALAKMQNHRLYANTPQSELVLSALARAMFIQRDKEGRHDKEPNPWREFATVVEALHRAGINILQNRPSAEQPLPALWTHPLTGQPLPPPKGMAERSLLAKLDPELSSLLDRLEKEPYQTVHRLRENAAKQKALASIPYDENVHRTNPFRRGDQTAMATLFKSDPMLAQFCQAEAKDVELNLFGSTRDLTVRGRLIKDPAAAAIVELGERVYEQWRQSDKAQLLESKAAAEQKLAELSASETPRPQRIARIGGE